MQSISAPQKHTYVLVHNFLLLYKADKPAEPHHVLRVDECVLTFSDEEQLCLLAVDMPHPEPAAIRIQARPVTYCAMPEYVPVRVGVAAAGLGRCAEHGGAVVDRLPRGAPKHRHRVAAAGARPCDDSSRPAPHMHCRRPLVVGVLRVAATPVRVPPLSCCCCTDPAHTHMSLARRESQQIHFNVDLGCVSVRL